MADEKVMEHAPRYDDVALEKEFQEKRQRQITKDLSVK